MIILYTFINETKHQPLLDRYLPFFSQEIKKDILRYRRWQDAQLSLLGKVLLQYGLKTYYNISDAETGIRPNKKPYLKGLDLDLNFNISHSKNLVVCAIAEFPVGIDVEFFDTSINYLDFEFQMTNDEFEKIDRSEDRIKSFFRYWTAKEAVIKAHGDGMMIPLDSFEVSNNEALINGEKFFTREIFIHEDYHSFISSSDQKIKDVIPFIEHFEIEI